MKPVLKTSIVHVYIYGLIKRELKGRNIAHISTIHPIIRWFLRFPKKCQFDFIEELVECGFLKKKGRDTYEIMTLPNHIKCRPPYDSLGEPLW